MSALDELINAIHGGAEIPVSPDALVGALRVLNPDPATSGSLTALLKDLAEQAGLFQVSLVVHADGRWGLRVSPTPLRVSECPSDGTKAKKRKVCKTPGGGYTTCDEVIDQVPLDPLQAHDLLVGLARSLLDEAKLAPGDVVFFVNSDGLLNASTPLPQTPP